MAVVGGDAIAGEARPGTLRYLLIRPVGRTHLLVAKMVSVVAFVVLAVLVVAVVAYVEGRFLLGQGPGDRHRERLRHHAHPAGAARAHGRWPSAT